MCHEITSADGLVLARNRAWHGLGVVVNDAPLPTKRCRWQARLVGRAVDARRPSGRRSIPVLTPGPECSWRQPPNLGVVGSGHRPAQNAELTEFATQFGACGNVEVESAGSIRGGRRVWFLIRGGSICLHDADEVRPYLLIANGHDGTLAMTCRPTTIRVVCKNTLHASLRHASAADTGALIREMTNSGHEASLLASLSNSGGAK